MEKYSKQYDYKYFIQVYTEMPLNINLKVYFQLWNFFNKKY